MKTIAKQLNIFMEPGQEYVPISKRACYLKEGDVNVLQIDCRNVFNFSFDNRSDVRMAVLLLSNDKAAKAAEIARAFQLHRNSVRNIIDRYGDGGLGSIHEAKRGPKGPTKARAAVRRRIIAMKQAGLSNAVIAQRLSIHERTVRRVVPAQGAALVEATGPTQTALRGAGFETTPVAGAQVTGALT
ncbi:MAG: helix-turn-helix domain-containing protein, partial [Sedimentisphaerales bacterium]|nr:helix-turn-helix domain-containing protein [Sedimentisphaerales bacterium]